MAHLVCTCTNGCSIKLTFAHFQDLLDRQPLCWVDLLLDDLIAEVAVTVAGRDVDKRLEAPHALGQVHELFGAAHVHRDGLAQLVVKLD